jgi:hypothetical protein
MTTALSFNSNYMQADKADSAKKRFGVLIAIGVTVSVLFALGIYELWIHFHKPKIVVK